MEKVWREKMRMAAKFWYLGFTIVLLGGMVLNFSLTISIQPKKNPDIELSFPEQVHASSDPTAFIAIWNTSKTSIGSSSSNQVCLPLESEGNYDFFVDWGDGSNNTITVWNQTESTHTYSSPGIYTIQITGTIRGWCFDNDRDKNKIQIIQQWGCLELGNSGSYFNGCYDLRLMALDPLNLTGTTTLYRCFSHCYNLGSGNHLNDWDVSTITNMRRMFLECDLFNMSINAWNVSRVKDMSSMFYGARDFNQPLNLWDVSSVIDMGAMFASTDKFNQPLEHWNVSSVTDMHSLFYRASAFDQPLGTWDVSNVTDMHSMFARARMFDQSLGTWDISNVTDMHSMFFLATLSTENYDALLIGWSKLPLQNGVFFDGGNSKYSRTAKNERKLLIQTFDWIIIDGGRASEFKLLLLITSISIFLVVSTVITFTVVKRMKKCDRKMATIKKKSKGVKKRKKRVVFTIILSSLLILSLGIGIPGFLHLRKSIKVFMVLDVQLEHEPVVGNEVKLYIIATDYNLVHHNVKTIKFGNLCKKQLHIWVYEYNPHGFEWPMYDTYTNTIQYTFRSAGIWQIIAEGYTMEINVTRPT